jgi:hypothetical protein
MEIGRKAQVYVAFAFDLFHAQKTKIDVCSFRPEAWRSLGQLCRHFVSTLKNKYISWEEKPSRPQIDKLDLQDVAPSTDKSTVN